MLQHKNLYGRLVPDTPLPHLLSATGITASMGQMTMPRTFQLLQRKCTRRKENSTPRANMFQMERDTQVLARLRGCKDLGNEGVANVVLLSSDYTLSPRLQK